MGNRFPCFRLPTSLVVAVLAGGLAVPGAQAALKKYTVQGNFVIDSNFTSPDPDFNLRELDPEQGSRAIIFEAGLSPVLKKLQTVRDRTVTTVVPELGGFIFTSNYQVVGPRGEFTGTGSTDTTIAWGVLTGWTITGTTWCHAAPAFICEISSTPQDESVDPVVRSPFYDLGTWTFHGTGWTATPYVQQNFFVDPGPPSGDGNLQWFYRGAEVLDGTIPALPVVGLAMLSGSLILGSLAVLRRGGK